MENDTTENNIIAYDDFKKTQLKIAKIISAQRVEGSDKLLQLQVDLGTEQRQIIAGIGRAYEPEKLVGTQIAIVANLAPRALMGLESQGMLLAATNADGLPMLLRPEQEVPPGTEVK